MSTITITGNFNNSNNNTLSLDVFQFGTNGYNFHKRYQSSFTEVFDDLLPDNTYYIEITGSTTGTFDIKIDGDIQNSISKSYSSFFMADFTIKS
ncbi:hypothetical protein [uncultured Mucilaginibacter sp.]|uniref:hypothetical protein n=1 Tax=uncultured Mucilaginibacter sp. TaxID=797541 RepID=UPI0025F3D023|nr:hypothetical protein [uncultured Mucilaginibacter sp.]